LFIGGLVYVKLVALAAVAALGLTACGQEDLGGAPNVKGLTLDVAKQQLKDAGYGVSVKDDSLFGVIVESHFTVCHEHSPNGSLVPLDVSKNC
jgi:beta-lactam-binding protein with PASTA domain